MIVIDTSAIIAILQGEPEAIAFRDAMTDASGVCMSAVSLQEAAMVLAGRLGSTDNPWAALDRLIATVGIEIVPHDRALAHVARDACLRFGKGHHPAGLNCGDCAAYALAKARNLPLLFKGNDFARTDLMAAA